ncbi:ATP-binding cassette domain-containing protein [Candidatus Saccharibacteria bacterium]|nr:ATP-binding cassette domain-containing protein [Candidatus Saccharibacteria bacterium]
MLKIKNVSKIYRSDEVELKALDSVSVNLRDNEFVSILGPSGSGKTTLLNIIGGLDHYTSGDIIIDGTSTKDYTDRDWDSYRNHRVGFVFQNYNLIQHQSVLANVELALTLSGVSASERRARAKNVLKEVGLEKHMNKRPNQLSGGQMQRVAIARALVNNPDIVLADEPTGSLDSKTSTQIMELLMKVAKDKLVVMVTHNPELAKKYSTRIINVKDGRIVSDTNPFNGKEEKLSEKKHKYTSMGIGTALSLSKNNLLTKCGRTILVAIAGSIGIIGIALVLALASGVNKITDKSMELGSIVSPITIQKSYLENGIFSELSNLGTSTTDNSQNAVLAIDDLTNNSIITKQNHVKHNDTAALKKYIDSHASEMKSFTESVNYDYDIDFIVFDKDKLGNTMKISPIEKIVYNSTSSSSTGLGLEDVGTTEISEYDILRNSFKEIVSTKAYDVVSGHLPENSNELLLVVNENGSLPLSTAYALNLVDRSELRQYIEEINAGASHQFSNVSLNYNDIIGKTYRVNITPGDNYDNGYELAVVGIAKIKNEADESGYIGYTPELEEKIVMANDQYDLASPATINIIAKSPTDKAKVTEFLDNYNNQVNNESEKIHYIDQTKVIADILKDIVNAVSTVLIGFIAISLVVSSIMIGIITYISVLERTKEIGILRAIGASKRDVARVFRAETIIEGFFAGVLGVFVSWLLCLLINFVISIFSPDFGGDIADFSIVAALILILVSVLLTVLAGAIPAKRASRKDPVEALRSE